MAIIRSASPAKNFTVIRNDVLNDERLSLAAVGLLCWLIARHDGWQVSVKGLMALWKGSGREIGRDALNGLLRELVEAGYVVRQQSRSESGRMAEMDYVVFDTPQTDSPCTDLPYTEKPLTAEPYTANPHQPNTKTSTKYELEPRTDKTLARTPAGDAAPASTDAKKQANADTWKAYSDAFFARYETEPVRNAKVNGQIAQLVARLGAEEAPQVARFFLGHNDLYYVRKTHSVDLLLHDCESLRTQWANGRAMTTAAARQIERTQTNIDAVNEAFDAVAAKGKPNGAKW